MWNAKVFNLSMVLGRRGRSLSFFFGGSIPGSLLRAPQPQAWACIRPVSLYTQQLHIPLTHISHYTSQQHLNHRIPRTPLLRT
jgi:hypothetical protein